MSVKYQRKPGIMAADMGGETVMMDVDTGKYYNLGEVGGSIWTLLENPLSTDEIVSKLIDEYDVSEETCREDITPFIDKLLDSGLITKVEN